MANASGGGAARRDRPAVATWHKVAQPTARRRAFWAQGTDGTQWAACGWDWDAVAISPVSLGLDALTRMQLGPKAGYRVLADRLRDELYVLVAPGTAAAAAEVPGVHVLGRGRQLLMPTTDHGTFCAHWISARQSSPLLVPADQLVTALRELTDPTCLPHETAVS